jgi:hypothetical protein
MHATVCARQPLCADRCNLLLACNLLPLVSFVAVTVRVPAQTRLSSASRPYGAPAKASCGYGVVYHKQVETRVDCLLMYLLCHPLVCSHTICSQVAGAGVI